MDLPTLLIESAHQEGFLLAGVVDIDLAFSDSKHSIQKHIDQFDTWLKTGFSGSMDYLIRGRNPRANPRLLLPDAQSVFCVAMAYPKTPAGAAQLSEGPRYARYLHGRDYHKEIYEKLEKVMLSVKSKWNSTINPSQLHWKICVDTSAVLERSWAALAGLGWIGKNTLLIHPRHGSYLFLAEVLLNQATGKAPAPLPNLCGHCQRCLDTCPTQAFPKPHLLNSERCISYWTLEKRGHLNLSASDQSKTGAWIAGCDQCQEVCPFNIKPSRQELNDSASADSLKNKPSATHLHLWEDLLSESPEEYKKRVKFSAMNRIKPAQFSRNLAITLSNYLQSDLASPENIDSLKNYILKRISEESDPITLQEWTRCLHFMSMSTTKVSFNHFSKLDPDHV